MKKIAIFASGSGSNAENIINSFCKNSNITVSLILTNNKDAYVIQRAKKYNTPYTVFSKEEFYHSDSIINLLIDKKIDLIVLAGFMWLIPEKLINKFENKIINIHPSLLPKYGGKGMYGLKVHQAVIDNKEIKTGITIHYVNKHYDSGAIIRQETCIVEKTDNAEIIAQRVHDLEYKFFPLVIKDII